MKEAPLATSYGDWPAIHKSIINELLCGTLGPMVSSLLCGDCNLQCFLKVGSLKPATAKDLPQIQKFFLSFQSKGRESGLVQILF